MNAEVEWQGASSRPAAGKYQGSCERGEKRLRIRNRGKLRRRQEAFERGGEHCVGVGRTFGRFVKLVSASAACSSKLRAFCALASCGMGHASAQKASAAQRKLSERMDTAGALPSHGSESEES